MAALISKSIEKAAKILNSGGIVGIPTETVYGLGASIFNVNALKQIYQLKERPSTNPLIVHIANYEQLQSVVKEFPEKAEALTRAFWPGGLTLILPKNKSISSVISAGKETVALRMPDHKTTLKLIQLVGPVAAPSANPFERISPTSARQVASYFPNELPMILDGGKCKKGLESTIVGFNKNKVIVYRLGVVTIEELENTIGKVYINNDNSSKTVTPGMSKKHYAPITKTIVSKDIEIVMEEFKEQKIGVLHFNEFVAPKGIVAVSLSKKQCMEEAASNLYHQLYHLDQLKLDYIVVDPLPDIGLGKTINDRLKRAAHL